MSERTLRSVQEFLLQYLEDRNYVFEPPAEITSGYDMEVHPSGSWFILPKPENSNIYYKKFVGKTTGASAILKLLVDSYLSTPHRWIRNDDFFKAAWPDEDITSVPRQNRTVRLNRIFNLFRRTAFADLLQVRKSNGRQPPPGRRLKPFLNIRFRTLSQWPAKWPDLNIPGTPQYFQTALLPGTPVVNSCGQSFPFSSTKVDLAHQRLFPGVPTERGFINVKVFATYVDDRPA